MAAGDHLTPLERAHLWTELSSKLVGAVAIVAAAWWTYSNFTVERTHDPTMEVTVTPRSPDEPTVPWFDWNDGGGRPKPIVHKRNLLATNEDFRAGRYQLNPGVQYREPFACIAEPDRIDAIRARFWTDEGSVADLVSVDTFVEPVRGTP